jgi:hypothetical protein
MNRSDRSVTSKIDLELKRLRGEQGDPYPRLNALREKVYGEKAGDIQSIVGESIIEDWEDDSVGENEELASKNAPVEECVIEKIETSPQKAIKDTKTRILRKKKFRKKSKKQKKNRAKEKNNRNRVKRLLKIGNSLCDEPSAAWLGEAVHQEWTKVELLFQQLRDEQEMLKEYARNVAGELRLIRLLMEK